MRLTGELTVDPPSANPGERATKLRSQQEVRSLHYPHVTTRFDGHLSYSVKVLLTSCAVKRPVSFSGRG
jgi:hypothetical protein